MTNCICGEPFDSNECDWVFPCACCVDFERRLEPYKKKGTGTAQERRKNRLEMNRIMEESCPYASENKRLEQEQETYNRDIKNKIEIDV